MLVGASFGAVAVGMGLPLWTPVVMSLVVFAGGSQFLAVALIGAGASPVTAVFAGLLLNLRHLPFGLAIADVIGDRLAAKLVGAHVLIDESVAFALAQSNRAAARSVYWVVGIGLFVVWNVGTVGGALAGQAMGDPNAYGVDAAFPAVLVALMMPSFADRRTLVAAVVGGVVAAATTPFLPAGLPVMLALLAMLVPFVWKGKKVSSCP